MHFNSLHSLTQWTAGIRLAMFEHASLQELYTGSLIAGKGKYLNNIKAILERLKFVEEDWARVRFGAGTPWRRCWYVIEPPDEKEWQKTQKSLKKRGAYEKPEYPKGDIKFYEKKGKKATPIATISDVYSAYAVYPQSKPLIEQSTLVKLEGKITIHSKPESVTEGFVFVMPEVHPAVTGFEMMLRYLFPVYDTFSLYGRPTRLIADTLDARGLMFAMPKDRRYGYLDIIDVAGLIHTDNSDKWSEREWRKRMKELVSRRMSMATQGRTSNVETSGRRSLGSRPGIRYEDSESLMSTSTAVNQSTDMVFESPKKTYTAPPASNSMPSHINHSRSVSESVGMRSQSKQRKYVPSRLSVDQDAREHEEADNITPPPMPISHRHPYKNGMTSENGIMTSSNSSDSELGPGVGPDEVTHDLLPEPTPPAPVSQPFFQHQASDKPQKRPVVRPELRREKSRMSNSTLDQLVDASKHGVGSGNGVDAGAAAAAAWRANGRYEGQARGVNNHQYPNDREFDANPLEKAINTGQFSQTVAHGDPRIRDRPLVTRSQSDQTVTRKPLPTLPRPSPLTQTAAVLMYDQAPSSNYINTQNYEDHYSERKVSGGVRKTIGDLNYNREPQPTIPDVDFGLTPSLTPGNSRPGTAAGRVSPLENKTPSAPHTPKDERRLHADRVSPLPSPQSGPSSRPSSQLWHPGTMAGRQSPGGLTPEQFVQQRADMARYPTGYVQRRTVSSSRADELMKTTSPEPTQPKKLQKKRNPSGPDSRSSPVDLGSTLSAREQEHVARMTGSPLLNLPDRSRVPDPNVGLVGAISAREQDRRNIREGVSNHLVQASIAHRQQLQHQQAQSAYTHQVQAQYRPGMNAWSQQQSQYPVQNPYQQPQHFQQQPQSPYQQQQYPPQQFYPQNSYQQTQQNPNNPYGGYYAPPNGYRQ